MLLIKFIADFLRLGTGNPFNSCQAFRFLFDNLQRILAKALHDPFGHGCADAFERSGGQIF